MRQGLDIDEWGEAPAAVAVLHVERSASALAALLAELDPAGVSAVLCTTGLAPAKEAETFDVIRRAGFIPEPCVDGARLEAGIVYWAPTDRRIWFEGCRLRLGGPSPCERSSLDRVLQSLARAWGERSIVMAPTTLGSGAQHGLHAVRRAGGAVRMPGAPSHGRGPASIAPAAPSRESRAPVSRTAPRSQRPPAPAFRIQRLLPCGPSVLARLQAAVRLAVQRAAARDRVRAWVPGCKTGGFVHALAMLLCEAVADAGSNQRVQVFGTDPDEEALAVARAGRYPRRAAVGVDPRLRELYLAEEGEPDGALVRVADSLREACFFSSHKLARPAPFSRLDLIVCQRVFEGVPPSQRDDAVSELCAALREEGVLFSVDGVRHFENGCFELAPEGHLDPRPARPRAPASPRGRRSEPPSAPSRGPDAEQPPPPRTSSALLAGPKLELELLVEAVGVPVLLVDEQLRLLYLSSSASSRFGLSPAQRRLPLESLVLQLPGRRELLHAAARALETGATRELALGLGVRTYLVRVSVGQSARGRLVALLFTDVSALEAAADRTLLLRHRQAAVARLGELALASCRLPALCEEALSLLVADIPACRAGLIAECVADAAPLAVLASRGLGADPLRTLRAAGEPQRLIDCVIARRARAGESLEHAEVSSAPSRATPVWLASASEAGEFASARLEGGAAWPIVADGVVLGVIALYSARGELDATELQRFVQGAAHVLAGAMVRERTRQRLELEHEVDGVVAGAGDLVALGRGLLPLLRAALAGEVLEIWCAMAEPAGAWQRHFPELAPATAAPPWPCELLARGEPLYRAPPGSERPSELWLPVPCRSGVTAMLRISGAGLRAPRRELEAGLASIARRLAPVFDRWRAQRDARHSEAERRRALTELEALCATPPLGISIHDRSGAVRRGLHLAPDDWLGRLYSEELPAWIERVIDTGEAIHELELSVVSGAERRSWLCSIRPLRDDGGIPSGAIAVVHDPAEAPPSSASTRARPESSILPRRSSVLLIAEDGAERDTLGALLDPASYDLETASGLDAAVRDALERRPDLVLCDFDSPAIDVLAVSEQIRAIDGAGQLGLIALTRDSGALTRLRVEEAGFDDHLTQPVRRDALQRCLSRLSAAPTLRRRR